MRAVISNTLRSKTLILSSQKVVRGLGKYTAAVERVVNDLANRRSVRVDVHAGTCPKMPDDAVMCDVVSVARQF